jgi:hypothetical protein
MATAVMPFRWAGVRVGQKPSRRLLAVVGQVQHPALLQIGHDRQVPIPLGHGLLIDLERRWGPAQWR